MKKIFNITKNLGAWTFFLGCSSLCLEAMAEVSHEAIAAVSEAPAEAEAIVVTGTRSARQISEAPVRTELIDQKAIRRSGADNLQDLLEEAPQLNIERAFGRSGLQLRGLDSKYTLIVVDGQRVSGRVGGIQDLSLLPAEQLERVEIVRGTASMLYGADAIGGVVNLISRQPTEPFSARGRAAYGSRNTADLSAEVGGKLDTLSLSANAGYHRDDGYDLTADSPQRLGPGFEQLNLGQRAKWQPTRRFSLEQRVNYVFRDASAIDATGGGAVLDRGSRIQTLNTLLRPEYEIDDAHSIAFRAGYSLYDDRFRLDQRGDDALDQRQDTRQHLAEFGVQSSHLLGGRHLLTAAVEGFVESLASGRLEPGDAQRGRFGALIQDEWALSDDPLWVLVPGVRVDHDTRFGTYPSPRIALRFDPSERVQTRMSYGWGFRAPNFRELFLDFQNPGAGYLIEGNPDLEPERAQSADFSVEAQALSWLRLSAAGFFTHLDQLIQTVPEDVAAGGTQRFVYENVERAYIAGAELGVELALGKQVSLGGSYSFLRARDRSAGRPLEGRPQHRGSAKLSWTAPFGTSLVARVAITGERPFFQDIDGDGEEEQRTADRYALADLRVHHDFVAGLRVFALAENLLDAGEAEFLPIAPRTFSGGVEFSYP